MNKLNNKSKYYNVTWKLCTGQMHGFISAYFINWAKNEQRNQLLLNRPIDDASQSVLC
jgi:hypothetical protein